MRFRAILLTFFFCLEGWTPARSAPINTGVEDLLWPAVIIVAPVVIVNDLIFGSDRKAFESTRKEASKVLASFKQPIPVRGIYTNSLNLEGALQGVFVQSQVPLVEVDVAGSFWLLSKALSPQDLIEKSKTHKYIRLSLGTKGHANCFSWKSENDNFLQRVPVRPGACLLVSFTNELQSDLQIRVDSSRVRNWELKWELLERANNKVLLAVPFWQTQTKGQPLVVKPNYQEGYATDAFGGIIQKLSPSSDVKRADGLPFQLNWIRSWPQPPGLFIHDPVDVAGQFRQITLPWSSIPLFENNESWSDGYVRATATGSPVIMNNMLLITPKSDTVGPACVFPLSTRCDFANNFTSEIGVLSLQQLPAFRSASFPNSAHEMSTVVAIRAYSGELRHFVKIIPKGIPPAASLCEDWSLGCRFYPRQATTTGQELVVRGVFSVSGNLARKLPKEEYELAVPLNGLPVPLGAPATGR